MQTRPGELGQFDVRVDGEVLASRKRGLLAMLGGGWPTADDVLQALEARESSPKR